ncbi:hypothetical protein NEOLI_004569 [Neolecta irregularis DAH-3]|uniref:Uncharacterized protein n=1 Tax=Neolecta irregularis (strain DAH-3) TaxID=1198029 RepID=A0A1U7LS08_NEOID|nr:hypothetical protein NEOLI_004569 [Neolecta irregularis DAH-3]|eukprot:OLL25456.1 hypothetical protein NEOLI_004569 [Neolecta irregularis DAH-3]
MSQEVDLITRIRDSLKKKDSPEVSDTLLSELAAKNGSNEQLKLQIDNQAKELRRFRGVHCENETLVFACNQKIDYIRTLEARIRDLEEQKSNLEFAAREVRAWCKDLETDAKTVRKGLRELDSRLHMSRKAAQQAESVAADCGDDVEDL